MNANSEMREIELPYGSSMLTVRLPGHHPCAILSPNAVPPCDDPLAEARRALRSRSNGPPLRATARGARRVVILADDLTRQTPVQIAIPALLDELNAGGVCDEQISVVIALGTHRPMTDAEIDARLGPGVTGRVRVQNSPWQDPTQLAAVGRTPNGTSVQITRMATDADLIVGVGSIIPHHIAGFSGGAKIVQPGISGAVTTGATHYLSTRTRRSYLGLLENPVRAEMEMIAERVGLRAVFNAVVDTEGRLIRAFCGDPRRAFRAGAALVQQVSGVPLRGEADIVIAGSHPCDLEFWQAHKSLYPADLAVRQGGTVVVVTPCPEGVSVTHRDMLNFTRLDASEIERLIDDGTIADVVSGALALAWAKVRQRARISLVSDGITTEEARALGFTRFASLEEALEEALHRHGPRARVTVLPHAPETLPVRGRPAS